MVMRPPAARLQINFNIAGHWFFIRELQHRTAKIRAAFHADKTGMQHAKHLAIRRLEPVALDSLVQPDGLQELFRRDGVLVVKRIAGTTIFAPAGVEIICI